MIEMIEHQTPCWILQIRGASSPSRLATRSQCEDAQEFWWSGPDRIDFVGWNPTYIPEESKWRGRSGFCFTFSRLVDFFIGFTFWFSSVLEPVVLYKSCVAPCESHEMFWRCCFGFWLQTYQPSNFGTKLTSPKNRLKRLWNFPLSFGGIFRVFSDL